MSTQVQNEIIKTKEESQALTAFLTTLLCVVCDVYEKSMRSMRSLWGSQTHPLKKDHITTSWHVVMFPGDLSMRSVCLIDKSMPLEYRYLFSTAIATTIIIISQSNRAKHYYVRNHVFFGGGMIHHDKQFLEKSWFCTKVILQFHGIVPSYLSHE